MRVIDYWFSDYCVGIHWVAHRWVMMHMDMYIFMHNMRMTTMHWVIVGVRVNMMASMLSSSFSRCWLRFRSRCRSRFRLRGRLFLLRRLLWFLVLITPVLLLPVIIVIFVARLPLKLVLGVLGSPLCLELIRILDVVAVVPVLVETVREAVRIIVVLLVVSSWVKLMSQLVSMMPVIQVISVHGVRAWHKSVGIIVINHMANRNSFVIKCVVSIVASMHHWHRMAISIVIFLAIVRISIHMHLMVLLFHWQNKVVTMLPVVPSLNVTIVLNDWLVSERVRIERVTYDRNRI